MEYILTPNKEGLFDITAIDELEKGDKLIVDGIEQIIADVHEGEVLTNCNGVEVVYEIRTDIDEGNTYLEKHEERDI
jgi:hypothetical protein